MEISRMTMASLADMLTPFVDRPVIDGTSLKAPYQVSLDLPFDAMMRVIQNLSGTAGMPAGFAGLGGFGPWPGAGGAGAVPELRPIRRVCRSFSPCTNSASSCNGARLLWIPS